MVPFLVPNWVPNWAEIGPFLCPKIDAQINWSDPPSSISIAAPITPGQCPRGGAKALFPPRAPGGKSFWPGHHGPFGFFVIPDINNSDDRNNS